MNTQDAIQIRTYRLPRAIYLLAVAVALIALSGLVGLASPANAETRQAQIFLLDRNDQRTSIGTVTFAPAANGTYGIEVVIEGPKLTDHFLSMRPFNCIEDATEWFCQMPYPYQLRNTISKDDLTDLSYRLLFIRKKPSDFGIDAWNGLYYKLKWEADGSISGQLYEGDLNSLASPPEEPFARPIDLSEFIPADKKRRLFPTLIIQ